MCSPIWARWATCALALPVALTLALPVALADRGASKKSLDACTIFEQTEKDDSTLALTVHSSCSIPIDCTISWRLVCAPDSKKRRAVHRGSAKLALATPSAGTAHASAAACGDDAWVMDSISWACEPNKD